MTVESFLGSQPIKRIRDGQLMNGKRLRRVRLNADRHFDSVRKTFYVVERGRQVSSVPLVALIFGACRSHNPSVSSRAHKQACTN